MRENHSQSLSSPEECFARLNSLPPTSLGKPQHAALQRASVLVLIDDQLCTLITKRSMNLRSHPGECCFPGGRQDDGENDIQTALREASEEVGLASQDVQIILQLPTVESVNHLCVTPVIARFTKEYANYPWKYNPTEVDSAVWVPLSFFLQEPDSKFDVEWSGEIFTMRSYVYESTDDGTAFSITGLTAHIAHQAAQAAYGAREETVDTNITNNSNTASEAGYLWRKQESSRGRSYWTRRYFVLSDQRMLHQYDSLEQSRRKGNAATKKNRLSLDDVTIEAVSRPNQGNMHRQEANEKFEFKLQHQTESQVVWNLASESSAERNDWIARIKSAANQT